MKVFKNPYISAAMLIGCIVAWNWEANARYSIGWLFNEFSPCVQPPAMSAPCFIRIDIIALLLIFVIGLASLSLLIYQIYKRLRS